MGPPPVRGHLRAQAWPACPCFTRHGFLPVASLLLPWAGCLRGRTLAALAMCAIACVAAALRAQRVAWAPMALLWLLLGAWCAEMEPDPAPDQPLLALSDGLLRTAEGTVTSAGPVRAETELSVDDPAAKSPCRSIDVRLSSVEVVNDVEDAQAPVAGSVRLTVRWPRPQVPAPFSCGEQIRAVVRLASAGTVSRSGRMEPHRLPAGPGSHGHGVSECCAD